MQHEVNDPTNIVGMANIYVGPSDELDKLEEMILNKDSSVINKPTPIEDYEKLLSDPKFDESYSFNLKLPPEPKVYEQPKIYSETPTVAPPVQSIFDGDEEDEKTRLIEQIDDLKRIITNEGQETKVPDVNLNTSLKDLRMCANVLQKRYDRVRYCDTMNELILASAYGLEILFDGKREILGTKIDLTDYSTVVKTKLRRMQNETGNFVQSVISKYNISSSARILFEIIPSLIMHAHSRSTRKHDTTINEKDYTNAVSDMNT